MSKVTRRVDAPSETTNTSAAEGSKPDSAESAKGRKGAIPTMPYCVVYRSGTKVVAAIVSPNGEKYVSEGRGQGSAMGGLIDRGFSLAGLHAEGPQWIRAMALAPAEEIIGYAAISGFPIPAQD